MTLEFTTIEEELDKRGVCYLPTVGYSMAPLLSTHKNVVTLTRSEERAKKMDVILFHRPDGRYVLHRVVKVTPDGYFTRGDNYLRNDAFVPEEQFIAIMTGYTKKGKNISLSSLRYRLYVFFWGRPNPVRYCLQWMREVLRKIRHKR
jgi:hypothetical protein